MEYTIIEDGKSYDLPKHSVKISNEMESIEKFKANAKSVKDQLKKMYDFCREMLGDENAGELLGDFEDSDPNVINIVYLDIVEAYRKPIEDYEREKQSETLSRYDLKKYIEIFNAFSKAAPLLDKK